MIEPTDNLSAPDLSHALFEESGDALFLIDPETDRLIDANPMAQLLSGFARHELLRFPATYLFRSDGKGGLHRLRHAAEHTGSFHSQEGYFLRTNQDGVWVPVNLTIARLHVQPRTLSLITARDVREQREAHAQLRQMEAELRRVLGSVSDCLWSADIDSTGQWTYRFVSPVIERITGRSPDFFRIGVEQWKRVLHAEDRPRWNAAIARLRSQPGSEEEYRVVRPDGAVRWVRDSIVARRQEDSAVLRLDGVLTDVTQRRAAEAELALERDQLRTLMENVPDLIYFKDADSRFTRVNRALAVRFGFTTVDEIVGKSDDDFFPAEEAARYRADELRLLDNKQAIINQLEPQLGPDGAPRWFLTTKMPVFESDGTAVGLVGVSRDITARKRAEEELHRANEKLRALIQASPVAMIDYDTDSVVRGWNPAAERMFGWNEAEALGRTVFIAPHDKVEEIAGLRERCLRGESFTDFETQRIRKDGTRIDISLSAAPLYDAGGAVTGIMAVLADITGRKRSEERLREAEGNYRGIFENALEGIYQSTPDGRFVTVNPRLARVLGFASPAELLATLKVDQRFFYADPRRRAEFVRRVEAEGAVAAFESEIVRQDGARAWISESARARRAADGTLLGYEGTLVEITEHKRAEAALRRERSLLRSLIDAIPDPLAYKDTDGVYLGCNAAFEQFAERAEHEVVGRTDRDLLPSDRADAARASDREVLDAGQPRRAEEWVSVPDGGRVLVETLQTPFHDPDGRLSGLISMSRDVTERRRLEEQLRQAQKMEAIGQLAGGVAHDFNNLLTAILGNVSLLLAAKAPADPDHELLAATEQAAQRATDLTRQLLGFSRQTMLRLEPTALDASVREVVGILRRTIDPRIDLSVHAAADLWLVRADPGQINQVLMNLCLNARDALPEGGCMVLETANVALEPAQVRHHLEARPGEHVLLRVRDSGPGIPDDVRPRIFEPFFTTKDPGKGTGLGLAMVYGIVRQHQGWIECHSASGEGTRFDIFLPRFRETEPRAEAPPTAPEPGRGSETILLVDDEAVIRNLGRAILQRQGYDVLLAADGPEAIALYQREASRIRLVVLDLMMPRLSGMDTLRQLRAFDPRVRVVLSSGYTADHVPAVGSEGVCGFVNKPYRPQDLTGAVRAALDQKLI